MVLRVLGTIIAQTQLHCSGTNNHSSCTRSIIQQNTHSQSHKKTFVNRTHRIWNMNCGVTSNTCRMSSTAYLHLKHRRPGHHNHYPAPPHRPGTRTTPSASSRWGRGTHLPPPQLPPDPSPRRARPTARTPGGRGQGWRPGRSGGDRQRGSPGRGRGARTGAGCTPRRPTCCCSSSAASPETKANPRNGTGSVAMGVSAQRFGCGSGASCAPAWWRTARTGGRGRVSSPWRWPVFQRRGDGEPEAREREISIWRRRIREFLRFHNRMGRGKLHYRAGLLEFFCFFFFWQN